MELGLWIVSSVQEEVSRAAGPCDVLQTPGTQKDRAHTPAQDDRRCSRWTQGFLSPSRSGAGREGMAGAEGQNRAGRERLRWSLDPHGVCSGAGTLYPPEPQFPGLQHQPDVDLAVEVAVGLSTRAQVRRPVLRPSSLGFLHRQRGQEEVCQGSAAAPTPALDAGEAAQPEKAMTQIP